jgi:hypothetical protein
MYRYDLGLYYLKTIGGSKALPLCPVWQMFRILGLISAFLAMSFFDSLLQSLGLFRRGILPWLGHTFRSSPYAAHLAEVRQTGMHAH